MTAERRSTPEPPGPSRLAIALATIGGNLYLVIGSTIMATLAILVSWVPPRGNLVFEVARLWSRGLLFFSGVKIDEQGAAKLDPQRCFIYMSNHQSLYDIPALMVSLPGQARFIAKRSLFWIPIFGWALKLGGFISVDRENRAQAGHSFSSAVQRLQEGVSTLVFPEGERSFDGRLLAFERGGFLLALKCGLAIVPVGIRGSLPVRRRDGWRVRPGTIAVRYGSPIAVTEYGVRGKKELMSEVRRQIAELAAIETTGC